MIKLVDVNHYYGQQLTINKVSMTINQGEFVYILGSSGAGKSTLIKLIYNDELVSSGEIMVAGHNLTRLEAEDRVTFRQQIGIIFQQYLLLQRYTVRENLAYPLQLKGYQADEIKRRVVSVLSYVGLEKKAEDFPEALSGGEQQRVAIARALITRPSVLIADEPTGNLDPKNSRLILALLEKISQEGTTVVMVTHDYKLVEQFPHRRLVLKNGQLVSDLEVSERKERLNGFS